MVKFKNSFCNIRSIRGLRLWQTLYVARKTIGVYSGDKSNIQYNFARDATTPKARRNAFWMAATTINAVQEHNDYSITFGFTAAPSNLNIYISSLSKNLASTPLFGKRYANNISTAYANTFLVNHTGNELLLSAFYASFFSTLPGWGRLDIAIGYNRDNINELTSDHMKETEYHELSHASHYAKLGTVWYTNFVSAEVAEIAVHPWGALNPYGDGTSTSSPIIALGEAWAYHMGHFLADQRYGTFCDCQTIQTGAIAHCTSVVNPAHSHIDALEAFDPNLGVDPFRWIPKGLMEDLMDNTNETNFPVADQVAGFTIAQMFNALQPSVFTLQDYRMMLIQQNTANTTVNQVTNLFSQYHY